MGFYKSENEEWKNEFWKAAARMIINLAAVVPFMAIAVGSGVLLSGLIAPPFECSCKSVSHQPKRTPAVRWNETRQLMPLGPTPKSETLAPLIIEPFREPH